MNIPFKMNIAEQLRQLTGAAQPKSTPTLASGLGSESLGKPCGMGAADALPRSCKGGACTTTWKPKRTAA